MRLGLGNMLVNGGSLNADGLSLDLQFAADKTLAARKGPTPTFTRASTATYFAPSQINAVYTFDGNNYNVNLDQTTLLNGRYRWENGDTGLSYTGTAWTLGQDGNTVATSAPTSNAWRPDLADWSGTGAVITATSTFGIVRSAVNEPRFDHDTTAPNACRGLLIEESRTNLVFPSATLTTQTRTVTATAHTLSFHGTGTVVLSGAHVATVTGTGAFPTRTTLTFTPTAGSLTLTVTGTVQFAQLEAGALASSYIPTTTGSVIRSADVCSITGADFTGFYNQPEGTWVPALVQGSPSSPFSPLIEPAGSGPIVNLFGNNVALGINNIFSFSYPTPIIKGARSTIAFGYKSGDFAATINGGAMATSADARMGGNITSVTFGRRNTAAINGHIASVRYYKKRLPNAKLQSLTV